MSVDNWPETRAAVGRLRYSLRAIWAVWLSARLFDVLAKMGCDREAVLAFHIMQAIPIPASTKEHKTDKSSS